MSSCRYDSSPSSTFCSASCTVCGQSCLRPQNDSLCFRQRGITFSPSVPVRPLPNLRTQYFENELTDFDANWHEKVKKGNEVNLYSAFIVVPHTQGAQVRITQCYLQITPYLLLPRKHSPDGASPDWGCGHLIAAYYSFIYPERMKGWVGLVGWPTEDGLPT